MLASLERSLYLKLYSPGTYIISKSLKFLDKLRTIFQIFEKFGLLFLIFPNYLIFHQLGSVIGFHTLNAYLKGDDYANDDGFIFGLVVASLEFKFQRLLDQ